MPVHPDLIQGPYAPPPCTKGDWISDDTEGLTEVGGMTSAPIPWPRRKKTGRASLILCGDLVRAVKTESVEAICHWWGVGPTKVWMWRQALGVDRVTPGTRLLLQERTGVPPDAAARGRVAASTPESRAKMAATKRGRPAHPRTREALLTAAKRPKGKEWGLRANAWMLGRGSKNYPSTPLYSPYDISTLLIEYPNKPAKVVAKILGRTAAAIYGIGSRLGLKRKNYKWTPELDQLIIDTRDMRAVDVAALIGRTYYAVTTRRKALRVGAQGGPKKRKGNNDGK